MLELNQASLDPVFYGPGAISVVGTVSALYFAWQGYAITALALGALSAISLIVTSALRDTDTLIQRRAGKGESESDSSSLIRITDATLSDNIHRAVYAVIQNSFGLIAEYIIFKPCEFLTRATIRLMESISNTKVAGKDELLVSLALFLHFV
ncbi:MAG: hypothetical protein AAGF04_00065 [Chlamydiota bacterium]